MAQNSGKTVRGRPFAPGTSGNPAGRPKLPDDVKEAARAYTQEAIGTLATVMRDQEAPHSARVKASESLLNRAWGTPEGTTNVNVTRSVREMTDAELVAIAAGGSAGVADAPNGTSEPGPVH